MLFAVIDNEKEFVFCNVKNAWLDSKLVNEHDGCRGGKCGVKLLSAVVIIHCRD